MRCITTQFHARLGKELKRSQGSVPAELRQGLVPLAARLEYLGVWDSVLLEPNCSISEPEPLSELLRMYANVFIAGSTQHFVVGLSNEEPSIVLCCLSGPTSPLQGCMHQDLDQVLTCRTQVLTCPSSS